MSLLLRTVDQPEFSGRRSVQLDDSGQHVRHGRRPAFAGHRRRSGPKADHRDGFPAGQLVSDVTGVFTRL